MSLLRSKLSVSMFPLNLQLTPTHVLTITSIIHGCSQSGHLIQLSHVTIEIGIYQ